METYYIFPGLPFILEEFRSMLADFCGFKEYAVAVPAYAHAVGRYFPLFWNGSADWLAVDLGPEAAGCIVLLEHDDPDLAHVVYPSLEALIRDAIRAYSRRENMRLIKAAPVGGRPRRRVRATPPAAPPPRAKAQARRQPQPHPRKPVAVLLAELETAIRARSESLVRLLQPGLSESKVRAALKRAGVPGVVEPIVAVYTWRDGRRVPPDTPLRDATFLPGTVYTFLSFDAALEQYRMREECAILDRRGKANRRRYFPVFWDGSTGTIALDTARARAGRVVLVDAELGEESPRELYRSLKHFLADAIRANVEQDALACLWGHV
jgi:hypothetical protein